MTADPRRGRRAARGAEGRSGRGEDYEAVIGLEVHTHLRTESKLFSPAPVSYGADPNHRVHPICLALPGVLPVLNARAVEFAIRAALATHCTVHTRSVFARKNYFYPDLPKGYQIPSTKSRSRRAGGSRSRSRTATAALRRSGSG
jgi:Asp-tRNA(Asn)/Glu-tRNA(Gln) amidotransferase B subunit